MLMLVMDAQYKKIFFFSVIGLVAGALVTGLVLFMGYRTCQASSETIAAVRELMDKPQRKHAEIAENGDALTEDMPSRQGLITTEVKRSAQADLETSLARFEALNTSLLDELDVLEEENFNLEDLNSTLKIQIEDILNWMLVNYEGKHPLPDESVPALAFTPTTDELMLNPAVAEFLHITVAEEAIINDAFAYARDVINQVEYELMTYRTPHEDKAILQIPPYYEEGELLRDDLYSSLETAIGVNRFDTFMDITGEKFDSTFNHFGNATHTIIFEVVYDADTGEPLLKIKDGWVSRNEKDEKVIHATESTLTGLPVQYAQYRDYLPMDFPLVHDQ